MMPGLIGRLKREAGKRRADGTAYGCVISGLFLIMKSRRNIKNNQAMKYCVLRRGWLTLVAEYRNTAGMALRAARR
jgi:hypothetical protein